MYLSFPHHFSALLLSRNIVRLFFACLLLSRCAYRGHRDRPLFVVLGEERAADGMEKYGESRSRQWMAALFRLRV
jgi:hypothetical protein